MAANLALVQARNHARLSQDDLARRVREAGRKIGAPNGCNRSTVGRWEARLTVPQPRMMAALETALGMPADRLGFGEITVTSEVITMPEPDDAVAADEAAMSAWRKADLRVGGAHLYPSVLAYLRDRVGPRLVMPGAGRAAYTSGAAVSEMAGWMAHDAGYDDLARQHFGSALNLARVSGDRQVTAHILASLGHIAHYTGDADGALRAAYAGLNVLASGPRDPDRLAYLYAIQARGYAARYQQDQAMGCLRAAEQALAVPRAEPASGWVNPFDEGAYANEAARVMRQLGHHGAAVRHAGRVMELRSPERPRSRAFAMLVQAESAAATGSPEQAAAVGVSILAATDGLSSYAVVRGFIALQRVLEPYRARAAVAEFLSLLTPALLERAWLPIGLPA